MLGIRNLSRDNGLAAFGGSVSVEHGTEAEHYRYLFEQCLYGIGILSELANPQVGQSTDAISSATAKGLAGYYGAIKELVWAIHPGIKSDEGLMPFPFARLKQKLPFDFDYETDPLIRQFDNQTTLRGWYWASFFLAVSAAQMLSATASSISWEEEGHALCTFWANIAALLLNVHDDEPNFTTVWKG